MTDLSIERIREIGPVAYVHPDDLARLETFGTIWGAHLSKVAFNGSVPLYTSTGAVEPVAWRVEWPEGLLEHFSNEATARVFEAKGATVTPLYISPPPVVPQGMKLVPVEPTREMLDAAVDVDAFKLGDISPLGFRISPQMLFEQCYRAMLAASPASEAPSDHIADVRPKLATLNKEKGPAGVWSNGFRSGWTNALEAALIASPAGREAGIEEAAKVADEFAADAGDKAARGFSTSEERVARNLARAIASKIRALSSQAGGGR